MSMPGITIGFGIALIVLGIGSYLLTGAASVTALIPAFFGIIIAVLGFVASKNQNARKHAMHGAAAVGLLGALATLLRLIPGLLAAISGESINMSATTSLLLMLILCAVFVGLCVQSFIAARRSGAV